MIPIFTADQVKVGKGDPIYDYYNMKPGVIDSEPDDSGWFWVLHSDGSKDLLDGTRICTLKHAERMGWK
jgi:hypothetical protein